MVPSEGKESALAPAPDNNDEFYDDIGYNKILDDYNALAHKDPELGRSISKLRTHADKCQELERLITDQESDLANAKEQTAALMKQDATQQKESDEKMERIRKMEEEAQKIHNAIKRHEEHTTEMESEIDTVECRIAYGPGPTDEQVQKKCSLSSAIDQYRSNAKENTIRITDLKSQIERAEKEVEVSIKERDKSIANLEAVNGMVDSAEERQQNAALHVNEAKRSREILVEKLSVAKIDLADLKAELDGDKQIIHDREQEIEKLQKARQSCSKEIEVLGQTEDKKAHELLKTRSENKEIEGGNHNKQKSLELIHKDRDSLNKERAKGSKVRELISAKMAATDKERAIHQNEADVISINITKLELEIPAIKKETEVLKRAIKRADHEFELISRKIGLSRQGSSRVADIIASNENTILSQQAELTGINRAICELQKDTEALIVEERKDEERLKRIIEMVQKKQVSLKSLGESISSLESQVTNAEEVMNEQHAKCEIARRNHNIESKTLMKLRENVYVAKTELVTLMSMMKNVKDEISRTDELVFKEHLTHHAVNEDTSSIENQIASFDSKTTSLQMMKARHESEIVKLGHDIDEEETKLELLRRQYRSIMGKKDILSAHLLASDIDHKRMQTAIQNKSVETRGVMNQYQTLQTELKQAKMKYCDSLEEKKDLQATLVHQRDQKELLSALEQDLTRQLDKCVALSSEIGRPINLHRWRYLQVENPQQYQKLEKIHHLQRKAISVSDRIALKTGNLERSKVELSKLRADVSGQQSEHDMKLQLSILKSELGTVSEDNKECEKELKDRITDCASIKSDLVQLEQKRYSLKADYFVSVISGH